MSSLEIGREEAFHLRRSEENTLGRVWPVTINWGPKSESPAFCSMAEELVANSNHLSTLVLQLLHSDSTHRHKRILQPSWTTVIAVEAGNPTCIFFSPTIYSKVDARSMKLPAPWPPGYLVLSFWRWHQFPSLFYYLFILRGYICSYIYC